MTKTIVCSFSGGETSAYMAIKLKEKYKDLVHCVFANTGIEREETLEFVKDCSEKFSLNVVWIEAVINPLKGKGTRYKIVNFDTASRNGEPFENQIKKYGLSNRVRKYCTRDLKSEPLDFYTKTKFPECEKAIGIRVDEIDRINPKYKEKNLIYPLAFNFPTTKNEVNYFWSKQNFRLNLKHYQGNCKGCYKKSERKLAWIMKESPEDFDFFERMENEHPYTNCQGHGTEKPIRIYRGEKTVADIREMSLIAVEPVDDARIYEVNGDLFGYDDDLDACGSESCEAF